MNDRIAILLGKNAAKYGFNSIKEYLEYQRKHGKRIGFFYLSFR